MTFAVRDLTGPELLGQRLKQLRQAAGLSVERLAGQLNVPAKYLNIIEACQYDQMPGLVYAKNFVRLYIRWAGLNEAAAMERFNAEYQILQAAHPPKHPLLAQRARTEISWWRRHLRALTAGAVMVGALAFFGWQIVRLYLPPPLLVVEPATDFRTDQAQVIVSGQTAVGAIVTLNNDPVEVNASGQFRQSVDLQPGINTLAIAAKTERSRARVVQRQILYEPKAEN